MAKLAAPVTHAKRSRLLRFINRILSILFVTALAACANNIPPATPTPTTTVSATQTPLAQPTAVPATEAPPRLEVSQSPVEVITNSAATGDGGNIWGGHQTRIVHTQAGIFAAYTEAGVDYYSKEWRLAQRVSENNWVVLAQGIAGREPVNLLAAPDGTLYIVAWSQGVGTLWSGKPATETLTMTSELIPAMPEGNWPYGSAGINANGDLCVLASNGGEGPGGEFYWSCRVQATGEWISQTSALDYRYCYTYVFPQANNQLTLVSTRDVRWSALGYTQPADAFDYVFNAFGVWRTADLQAQPLERISFIEEVPTAEYPNAFLNAQMDAYVDSKGRTHILYWQQGASTNGASQTRHRIVSTTGETIFDEPLPEAAGYYNRIFQDGHERFYILGSSGVLYPLDENGEQPGEPIRIDLGGYEVEYSGYGLSVPRTGTPLSDTMEVVFPSGDERLWLYFQLRFDDK